ncbi:hypothetical protein [uncultured Erythrobacter sp.]|uniref:hypothetical protein n=1 Tax=uncultured Erythrobacter sp. TaxID=263913 RepID=UPI002620CCD7|nr:hypothetical protein [uncultured Erythrobacter sp.]
MVELDDDVKRAAALRHRTRNTEVFGAIGSIGLIVVLFVIVIFGVYQCSQPTEVTEQELLDRENAAADEAKNRIKGLHCLSSWDGSNRSLVSFVKSGLREPDSFDHVDTLVTPKSEETGMHGITMTYRARNGFGGVNLSRAIGQVDPNTCEARNIIVSD